HHGLRRIVCPSAFAVLPRGGATGASDGVSAARPVFSSPPVDRPGPGSSRRVVGARAVRSGSGGELHAPGDRRLRLRWPLCLGRRRNRAAELGAVGRGRGRRGGGGAFGGIRVVAGGDQPKPR